MVVNYETCSSLKMMEDIIRRSQTTEYVSSKPHFLTSSNEDRHTKHPGSLEGSRRDTESGQCRLLFGGPESLAVHRCV